MVARSVDIKGRLAFIGFGDAESAEADAVLVQQFPDALCLDDTGRYVLESGAEKGMEAYEFRAEMDPPGHGTAVLTESGGPFAAYIIHAVTLGSGQDREARTVFEAFYSALKIAEKAGLNSIASPPLGLGALGHLSAAQSAQAMMAALDKYNGESGRALDVKFLIRRDPELPAPSIAVLRAFMDASDNRNYMQFDPDQPGAQPGKLTSFIDREMGSGEAPGPRPPRYNL